VVSPAVAGAAGLAAESLGKHTLKGFENTVELCRITGW